MRLFTNVLYVVGEHSAEAGLKRAIALTQRNNATLTLVSVVETMVSGSSSGRFFDELGEAFEALRAKRLSRLKKLAASVPRGIETVCEVMDGQSYMEVIRRVLLYNHDLVVTHAEQEERGPFGRLFVSEEMQLLRKCPCPVLLLKQAHAESSFSRIMASVDFEHVSDDEDGGASKAHLNDDIIDMAATIADQDGSHLDVVNIFTVPGEGAMIAGWIPMAPDNLSDYANSCRSEALDRLRASVSASQGRLGLPIFKTDRVETHLVKGRARTEIPELSAKLGTDLIVMGTVGRVGVSGLMIGNTAETILGAIDCSVLALKPEGFQSPVKAGNDNGAGETLL